MSNRYEGIDGVLRAQNLDEYSFDRAANEALALAYKIADEALDLNSPLCVYAKIKRDALVEAMKVLPEIKMSDTDSWSNLQRAIEEYRDLIAFLTKAVFPVHSAPEEDATGVAEDLAAEDMQPEGETGFNG